MSTCEQHLQVARLTAAGSAWYIGCATACCTIVQPNFKAFCGYITGNDAPRPQISGAMVANAASLVSCKFGYFDILF
jgi:hypothetical protein